jgi:hypothetical protein
MSDKWGTFQRPALAEELCRESGSVLILQPLGSLAERALDFAGWESKPPRWGDAKKQ